MQVQFRQWISDGSGAPYYARKKFSVEKPLASATAYVCGLGQFQFSINGQKVGNHELDPGWTNYRRLVEYVTFSVTELLVPGENVMGLQVGNGWYIKMDEGYTFSFPPFMPPNPNPYRPFGDTLPLAVRLELTYADGTTQVVDGDSSFRVHPHAVTMTNIYGSETMDGRMVPHGWDGIEFDDSHWAPAQICKGPEGKLLEQFQPPVQVIGSYEAKFLHRIGCRDIYDLGQNMSGILEFEVRGEAGDEIRVYPAEKLDEQGNVDQMAKGWAELSNCVTYRIGQSQRVELYRMTFTYFAGRYLAVEHDGAAELLSMTGHAISSAAVKAGSFSCDDHRLNQIYDLVEKAVEANMVSVHTDCPTIERYAWQEPNHLMAPSIFYMKDGRKLWEKFLLDLRTDQHTAQDYFMDLAGERFYPGDGLVPAMAPCYVPNVLPVPGMGSFYDTIAWGSTIILAPYWHYLFYGDISIVRDNYQAGVRYVAYLKSKLTPEGFISHGLGDWGHPKGQFLRENVETVFYYADLKTLAYFAGILGYKDDEERFAKEAETVKENYNGRLLVQHPQKGYWCYKAWCEPDQLVMTQASQAMPLFWGMVPEEYQKDIIQAFRDTLEEAEAFVCGEISLPYVIQTAARQGWHELICRFICRPDHPSYYAFVLDGETTLGEYWETNPRSHCHDMMGHIIEWYYNGLGGIQPLAPGFSQVKIAPYLPEHMKELQCAYQAPGGSICVHLIRKENCVTVEVFVPREIKYEVDLSQLGESVLTVNEYDSSREENV